MGLRVERYRPALRAAVVALEAHLWGDRPALNALYFEWKYELNPLAPAPLLHVALDGDEVVGVRGWFATRWERADTGEAVDALVGGDSVVAPSHRGQGVFRRINEAATADLASLGHAWLFNLSAEPITWRTSLGLGWRSPGPFRPIWRAATPGVNPAPPAPGGAGAVRAADAPRAEAMVELATRTARLARLRPVRDARWLGWRLQSPRSTYRYFFHGVDALEGYAVVQTAAGRAENDVRLVDVAASGPGVLVDLLDAVVAAYHHRPIIAWSTALPRDAVERLAGWGFRWADDSRGVTGYRPGLLVGATGDGVDPERWSLLGLRLLDPRSWYLPMLASDGY